MQNSSNNRQVERSDVYPASFVVESDSSATMTGNIGQGTVSQPNNSTSTGGHFFHRGMQQSPAFNTLLPAQGQSIYNGVYGTQAAYASQNSFAPSNYSNYGHVDASWISETRISTSAVSTSTQVDNNRNNRSVFADKNMSCNVQSFSHSCCGNRVGIAENINVCSSMPAESFRSKDFVNLQPKTNNALDAQSWFCSQGTMGYSSHQNQNHQQVNYKCNEQFPTCSVSQMNMLLQDQTDLKHSTQSNLPTSCFVSTQGNSSSANKRTEHSSNNKSLKQVFVDQNKVHGMKYCSLQKPSEMAQPLDNCSLPILAQQKHQEQNGYAGNSSLYIGDLPEDSLYSQASLILHMGSDGSHHSGRYQSNFISSKHNLTQNNISDVSKRFTVSPVLQHFQQQGRCGLEQGLPCDVVETCLQSEMKSTNENSTNLQSTVSTSSNCCQLPMGPSSNISHDNQSVFGSHIPRSNANSLSNCNMQTDSMQLCSDTPQQQLEIACSEADGKDESSSSTGESDIIVEETEEDISESEISIEEIKGSVFQETSARCLVCSMSAGSEASDNQQFVHMRGDSPVTSTSHIPVMIKLAEVVADSESQILKLQNEYICRRCFNLIDTVDCLETKLAAAKQDLIHLFETRLISLKALENWKANNEHLETSVQPDKKVKETVSEILTEHVPVEISKLENASDNCDQNVLPQEKCAVKFSDEFDKSCVKTEENEGDVKEIKKGGPKSFLLPEISVVDPETLTCKYSCEVCSKLFSNKDYLNKHHQQQHTKQFSFYCDRCGKGFTLKRALENHLLSHSGEFRYQCEICGKLFFQQYTLEDHLRKHDGRFCLICQYCEKGFMNRKSLCEHIRTHTGELPFICEHCGKRFNFGSNLIAHVRICSGDLPFNCNQCDKKFALEAQLKAHVLSKHEGFYRFKCTICGKGFNKDSDRRVHIRTHTKEKPHKCIECGKSYSSIGNLNQHAKQHGERPFRCSVCGQGFLRRSTLSSHMNIHDGVRPYSCDQCTKTFVAKRNLHAHRKWHAGTIKRYTCNICGKTFNHGLQVHMRTHSGIKPYTCSDCGMAFTVRSTLNKHIESKHQKIAQYEKQS